MSPSLAAEVHRHAAALRELARALVGDSNADDLLQDAAVHALQSTWQPDAPRSWLAAVLRRLAGKHRRAAARRRAHEQQAPSASPTQPPDQLTAQSEMLLRLSQALTSLPAPYRRVLMLRFFEDRKPAAIADATGEPLATVKSRLQRGLSLLRERLAADGGEWRAGLCAMFGWQLAKTTGVAATAASVTGVVLMGTGAKLTLSGAAALLAVLAWMLFGGSGSPDGRTVADGPDPVPPAAAHADLDADRATANERREVTPRTPPTAHAADLATLRGRCVDEQGQPLGGCALALGVDRTARSQDFEAARAYGQWLAAHPDRGFRDLDATTAADGTFVFSFAPPPLVYQLQLRRDALAFDLRVGPLAVGDDVDLGDLLLPGACEVHGRIVDTLGAPVLSAAFGVWPEKANRVDGQPCVPDTVTRPHLGPDGTFTMTLAPGTYKARTSRTFVRGDEFRIQPGAARFELELVVQAAASQDTITGTVVTGQGQPVADVTITSLSFVGMQSVTDELGRFVLARTPGAGDQAILMAERDGVRSADYQTCRWGDRDVRFQVEVELPCPLEIRVRDPDGGPVTDFHARLYLSREEYDGHFDDGILRVAELRSSARNLWIEPDRWDLSGSGLVPLPQDRTGTVRLDVTLPRAADRTLLVRDADGTPIAGLLVELLQARDAPISLASYAIPWTDPNAAGFRERPLLAQRGSTDAQGALVLHGRADATWTLRLPGPQIAPMLIPGVRLDDPTPLVITLPRAARLEGTLTPAPVVAELRSKWTPPPGAAADWRGEAWLPGFRLRRGDGASADLLPPRTEPPIAVAADGAFAFDAVPAGIWQLLLTAWDDNYRDGYGEVVASVTLREGETARVRVDLPQWCPAEVDGQLLLNGAPLPHADVWLQREGDAGRWSNLTKVTTADDGRFHLRARQGRLRAQLLFNVIQGNNVYATGVVSRDALFVPAGGTADGVLHIDTGKLRLCLQDSEGAPVAGVRLCLLGGDVRRNTPWTDADGRVELEIEAMPFSVQVLPKRLQSGKAQDELTVQLPKTSDPLAAYRLTLGSVTAKTGENVEATFRLPPDWSR